MINKLYWLLPVVLLSGLSACVSVYSPIQVQTSEFWNPRDATTSMPPAPRIIPGQQAWVFGPDGYDEAWAATGLFIRVAKTTSKIPTAEGVYIKAACDVTDDRTYFPLITLGTLFVMPTIIPIPLKEIHECETEFYQNGVKLSADDLRMVAGGAYGIAALFAYPFSGKNTKQNAADSNAMLVLHTITKLARSNP